MMGLLLIPVISGVTIGSVVAISKIGGKHAMKNIERFHRFNQNKEK